MDLQALQVFLAWSAGIHYVLLLVWFGVFALAHDWLYRVHSRWFKLSPERFDELNYLGVAIYKIGIMLFCLVPLAAVTVMRG